MPDGSENSKTPGLNQVLVVEDEESLLFAVSRILEKAGYSVLRAADGSAAVELLRRNVENVVLILLDVTLPGLSSREVFQEARRIRPDMAVILTSALSQNEVDALFRRNPGGPFHQEALPAWRPYQTVATGSGGRIASGCVTSGGTPASGKAWKQHIEGASLLRASFQPGSRRRDCERYLAPRPVRDPGRGSLW